MWGTDLTAIWTNEGQAAVFVAIDHRSAECVGIHAAARATRFEALEPIRQGVRRHFAAFAKDVARGLSVRHDHGSQYMSDRFQKELAFLGIESSPAFVRAPQGNGCAERFIRTLKENLLWVPDLRHHRAAPPRTDRVPGGLQHDLAHRAAWLPAARRHPSRAASSRGQGRVGSNQLSHQPQAVQPQVPACRDHQKRYCWRIPIKQLWPSMLGTSSVLSLPNRRHRAIRSS